MLLPIANFRLPILFKVPPPNLAIGNWKSAIV
jgi:hypothetical protein